jgi:hypothetical protein
MVVFAMSTLPLDVHPLPAISQPTAQAQEAPAIIAAVSETLIGMAIGVMVVSWLIFRRLVKREALVLHRTFPVLVSICGLASIYSGLRCEFEVALIIGRSAFDVGMITPFLAWQSGLLLLEVSLMASGAVHFFLWRDERSKL